MLAHFLKDENGSTAVEYAAIASLASIAILAGCLAIGQALAGRQFGALLTAWTQAQS